MSSYWHRERRARGAVRAAQARLRPADHHEMTPRRGTLRSRSVPRRARLPERRRPRVPVRPASTVDDGASPPHVYDTSGPRIASICKPWPAQAAPPGSIAHRARRQTSARCTNARLVPPRLTEEIPLRRARESCTPSSCATRSRAGLAIILRTSGNPEQSPLSRAKFPR